MQNFAVVKMQSVFRSTLGGVGDSAGKMCGVVKGALSVLGIRTRN